MSAVSLLPDTAAATAGLGAVGSAIVPIDDLFVAFYNFKTDISVPAFGTTIDFQLKDIDRALYVAVARMKTDLCDWVGSMSIQHPGLRDRIESTLLGGYASTSDAFASAAATVAAVMGTIGPDGATPAQQRQAAQAFRTLDGIVSDAATGIATLQTDFADFKGRVHADMGALQGGTASIDDAIADLPHVMKRVLANEHSSVLGAGVAFKMAETFTDAYGAALRTLRTGLANGTSAGNSAGPAMISLATQWHTVASVTGEVAGQITEVEAGGLGDALGALNIGTAANEWRTLSDLAERIGTAMNGEGLLAPGAKVVA